MNRRHKGDWGMTARTEAIEERMAADFDSLHKRMEICEEDVRVARAIARRAGEAGWNDSMRIAKLQQDVELLLAANGELRERVEGLEARLPVAALLPGE
jgi:hypothetical protein